MDYLRIDPLMDEHPDVEEAGFAAVAVFQAVLRAIARNDGHGILRAKFATPRWLAKRLCLRPEDIGGGEPETWIAQALDRCARCGLACRNQDGDLVVPGWEKFYQPSKTNAERQAEFRNKHKPAESECAVDEAAVTPVTPVTPVTAVTTPVTSNATPLHSTPQNNTESKEGESVELEPEPTSPAVAGPPLSELQGLWNKTANPSLPRWQEMPKPRAKQAKAALRDRTLLSWAAVIQRINASSFCLGANDRGWVASPDWLIQPGVAAKVLEGKYDNRQAGRPQAHANPDLTVGRSTFDWEAYAAKASEDSS